MIARETPRVTPDPDPVDAAMAAIQPQRPTKLPASITPEKCEMEMTPAAFRTWKVG